MESHLLQMRGLKPGVNIRGLLIHKSHLLQMRGLKQLRCTNIQNRNCRIFYRCVD